MPERTAYSIAVLHPFWRYAVAIDERPDLPAIAFFQKADATKFHAQFCESHPAQTVVLLRRRWFRRDVEVVKAQC